MKKLRFGILATGKIARRLAGVMQNSSSCELIAAASRSQENARKFAAEFQTIEVTGYEALLERDDIDAVYIATPHPQHHEWCLRAIARGKHVLCEKPLTMTLAEAEEIADAAKKSGVLVSEAFMYRFHPQTKKLVEFVTSGAIGEVRWVQADFGFELEFNRESRLFANALGGGAILDVGCYTVSMARLIAGAASGVAFSDPTLIRATGQLNETEQTDHLAAALLEFPNGVMATVRCATSFKIGRRVQIEGTKGVIELNEPWFAGNAGATIRIRRGDEETIVETTDSQDLYAPMLEEFASCWRDGKTETSAMSLADSLGNMRVLEEWYSQIGVRYKC